VGLMHVRGDSDVANRGVTQRRLVAAERSGERRSEAGQLLRARRCRAYYTLELPHCKVKEESVSPRLLSSND
jgi:hypothetical protein